MIPTVKFANGKEFFYEHRDNDGTNVNVMGMHHYHRYFEIYYFIKGDCKYFIGNNTYTLMPGDVVLIPENVIHRTLYTSAYERKLLNFTADLIPESIGDGLDSMLYIYRNKDVAKEINRIFDEIDREYSLMDRHSEGAIEGLVASLFILLARNENKAVHKGVNTPFVAEAVKRISESGQSNISLKALAHTLSVSPEHLSRTFRKETGFGFNEYLTLVRLQRAEQLLLESDGTVSEIAYACGFNDSNYFSDKFKKAHGISPLKYRRERRRATEKI